MFTLYQQLFEVPVSGFPLTPSPLPFSLIPLCLSLSSLPLSRSPLLPLCLSPSLPSPSFSSSSSSSPGLGTHAQRVAAIAARVKELPAPNYHILKTLVRHFRKSVLSECIKNCHLKFIPSEYAIGVDYFVWQYFCGRASKSDVQVFRGEKFLLIMSPRKILLSNDQ